jgi:legumain
MSYNDAAHALRNPHKGKLFNAPTKKGGYDVNAGCVYSYEKKDVTAAKVLAVLTGDAATAGGPVLKSNENSNVFFYFADHGAPGLVAMPVGPYLYAD